MLVASLTSWTLETLRRDAASALDRGAQALEVRADFLDDPDPQKAREALPGTAVYTLRPRRAGGRWAGTEPDRLDLLQRASRAHFEYVDLEYDAGLKPRDLGAKCVLSFHDFGGVPATLEATLKRMAGHGPSVVKAVCRCETLEDELALVRLQKAFGPPASVFAMGPSALVSRVLGPKHGAPLVYASPGPSAEAAPGQPALGAMADLYRVQAVGKDTRVFGLAGHPLGHSLSPRLHNDAFHQDGIDAVYLPFDARDWNALWNARDLLGLQGLSVTLPHKEAALEAADGVSDTARSAGAANTLARRGGRWFADNTDAPAIRDALREGNVPLCDAAVLVLGAGGAARAACLALQEEGARIHVAGRTPERAGALARRFGGSAIPFPVRDVSGFDLVVNATPVGMWPGTDGTPLDPSLLSPAQAVFDMVYNPEETALLRAAKGLGCRTVGGMAMFVRQAALQRAIWEERGMD